MKDKTTTAANFSRERRDALFVGAGGVLLALAPTFAEAASGNPATTPPRVGGMPAGMAAPQASDAVVPIYDEPLHHVIMQNGEMRVMRVMIRAGESTMWHLQNLDFVNTIISGSQTKIAHWGEDKVLDVTMKAGTVRYGDYQRTPLVDKVSNVGQTLVHQVAFEIIDLEQGNYGAADRKSSPSFEVILDKPRVRGWRLKLEPGETTTIYRQDGPGLRVVLSGARLIEKRPGEVGEQISLRRGDAMFTKPGVRNITNAADEPLEVMEYELL